MIDTIEKESAAGKGEEGLACSKRLFKARRGGNVSFQG